jgi:hypothetical protein
MSSAEPETQSRYLTESLERLGRTIAEKAERNRPLQPEPQPKQTAQIVQLDFWEDGKRAAPNAVFRSALFPALNSQKRQFIKQTKLFSVSGVEVIFTGEQFDQTDLDVYLEILNLSKLQPLGSPVKFSAYSFLKSIGRQTGNTQHKWLHSVLTRLCGGVVDMTDHKKRYFGQLIHGGIRDEITLNYEITINPKFAVLFGFGMWATIDREQRRALGRNATAKALHTYYSSHAAPGPHNFETLAGIAGLTDKNPRKVKMKIIAAHDHLKNVGFLDGYEVTVDTIKPNVRHSPGQLRHIAKKASR